MHGRVDNWGPGALCSNEKISCVIFVEIIVITQLVNSLISWPDFTTHSCDLEMVSTKLGYGKLADTVIQNDISNLRINYESLHV